MPERPDNSVFYKYKLRASLREDCEDYEKRSTELTEMILKCRLEPLGNNEYGTDALHYGKRIVELLWESDWFIENAKEFIWFDSVAGNEENTYDEDNMLEGALKYRETD